MGGEQPPLSGPDLKRGVAAALVKEGGLLLGHAEGEAVLLTRCGGELLAVGAHCTHYGAPLADGLIVGDSIRCPWHHAAFSLRTGEMLRPPALANLACWRVEESGGVAVVSERRIDPPHLASGSTRAEDPDAPESIVILGGGAAGAVAAETLRREGYSRSVTIIEAGPAAPYDRPNLSKDYLAGTASEEWIPLRAPTFYADNGIELVLGRRVTAIDPHARAVFLDDGTSRRFGTLLIATGAIPVRLDIAPTGQRIHYLRSLSDSQSIIHAAAKAKRAVVLGASFIGLEVAAALRTRGLDVTVVGPESRPLERILGPELGDFVRAVHEEHGVDFRLGQVASAIGRTSVTLQSGEQLNADLVVAGIGVRPDTDLADGADISTDRGILVDEYLETSVPGIYAAGDVARWPDSHTGERVRVEHWVVAQRQGQTAARNMIVGSTGDRERFDAVPFFWSRHYNVAISYVGHALRWDEVKIEGDLARRDCAVTYLAQGRTLAVATVFRDRASLTAELALERRAWCPGSPPPYRAAISAA
jgi:NADPH-dependent 2,4-dienoyl-CoA reductase/sulfur reductase-like enzyme/nitrite reductase/ring-hydroxylating ferredoxin subunit